MGNAEGIHIDIKKPSISYLQDSFPSSNVSIYSNKSNTSNTCTIDTISTDNININYESETNDIKNSFTDDEFMVVTPLESDSYDFSYSKSNNNINTITNNNTYNVPVLYKNSSLDTLKIMQRRQSVKSSFKKYSNCVLVSKTFWDDNIKKLKNNDHNFIIYNQLCCNFLSNIINSDKNIKKILKKVKNGVHKISKQFFDLFGVIINSFANKNMDKLHKKVRKLKTFYKKIGFIKQKHYSVMKNAFHKTMNEEFESKYTLRVRFSFEQILTVCTDMITNNKLSLGEWIIDESILNNIKDLNTCLSDNISKKYLKQYMIGNFCSELILFLDDVNVYITIKDDVIKRDEFGEKIYYDYIVNDAPKQINISHDCRMNIQQHFDSNNIFLSNKHLGINIFSECIKEVKCLINKSIFTEFRKELTELHNNINKYTPTLNSSVTF